MRRLFPFFILLLAQIINLMIPIGFVRCVGVDGSECVELAGVGCFRCPDEAELAVAESTELAHSDSGCCKHHHCDSSAIVEVELIAEDCGCQHSMMDPSDQIVARSVIDDSLRVACTEPLLSDYWSAHRQIAPLVFGLRQFLLRPCVSPHLSVVTVTVLRV